MSHHLYKSKIENHRSLRGFTLIESLVFLFLFAVISIVFLETYTTGTRMIIESKNRLGATALANQEMEIIRSIAYASIGTTTGIPAGDLLEEKVISVNTVRYTVHTFVQYVDDAFDGTAATGDAIPNDYKRVRLSVAWGNRGSDQTVAIFGNFSPKGVETSGGGGVLSINVLDGSGSGVPNVTVHIVNASAGVDITAATDATGNIMLPGAPAGTEAYTLSVSKAGYYGATTYSTATFVPVDLHASVVAGVLNQKTIVIDQSSDITFATEDPFGTALPSIDYTITGGRLLGAKPLPDGSLVYDFSATGTTNGSGTASFADQSVGEYTVGITSGQYELYKVVPASAETNKFTVTAGVATDARAILLDRTIGSLKVLVQTQTDPVPLSGASVRLTNAVLAYDATVDTDAYGLAYFPTALPALAPGTYDLEVILLGYTTVSESVNITTALVTTLVEMIPN